MCKESEDNVSHLLLECLAFRDNLVQFEAENHVYQSYRRSSNFRLYQQFRPAVESPLLFGGGDSLPFDDKTVTLIYKFLYVTVGKVYCPRKEMLHELEASWVSM